MSTIKKMVESVELSAEKWSEEKRGMAIITSSSRQRPSLIQFVLFAFESFVEKVPFNSSGEECHVCEVFFFVFSSVHI